ncbi:MAG TPA: hypothetical protein P5519_05415 [Spirochaetia bacterium]|nr:hypothetical protein [Spirochaetales bacterium]HRS65308.1 hypothetical protein [Spirochaetia bacterium]HOT58640.1 hypothetical protein [Spirochaetales bacterium]HPD80929.1 hypothetical protein [Spirochaetales bacterium]HQK34459.1 hypothetical protein [Spirochaetales bacterium]
MKCNKLNGGIALLVLLNLAVFIGGVLLVKPDLERKSATAHGYYKSIITTTDTQTSNKFMQFIQAFYSKEPADSYVDFRSLAINYSSIQNYFSDFYNYYFSVMQPVYDSTKILQLPLPQEKLFVGYLQMQTESDYKKLSDYQKLLVDAAIPYKLFAVWYTKRTALGYSKHYPLFYPQDETMLAYARNFIENFAERGFPFEYLSRIMALELELLYRSARTVSFWDANQRWDNEVLKIVYKRIQEYKERFANNFTVHQTGAVHWILSMERLVDHEISDRGFFINREQKEALERESKLLGTIPGLQVALLQNDGSTGDLP